MSYLVLARKFRPQTFASIVGQEHISLALANAILRNRVPHAILLNGPRGTGKTTTARVLARALNCTGREIPFDRAADVRDARELVEPCGECSNCVGIAKGSSLAVWEIDGASNNSVDNVRELIESLRSVPPAGSKYKIYIIDEVHMLSTAAFNALLKSLEEPPPNTVFIFATTEPQKIPETVLSRCQRHDFRKLPTNTISAQLKYIAEQEGVLIDDNVCAFVARRAQGGMRDAQSMLDRLFASQEKTITLPLALQIFRSVDRQFFFDVSEAVFSKSPSRCFELIDQAFEQSVDLRTFVGDFIQHFRSLFITQLTLNERGRNASVNEDARRLLDCTPAEFDLLAAQVGRATDFDMERLLQHALQYGDQALRTEYPRYILEAGVAKMATLSSLRALPEILNELKKSQSGAPQTSDPAGQTSAARPAQSMSAASPTAASEAPAPHVARLGTLRWQEFVDFVGQQRQPILHALLKRVAAESENSGTLSLRGAKFDAEALQTAAQQKTLTSLLAEYSGKPNWKITITEITATKLTGTKLTGTKLTANQMTGTETAPGSAPSSASQEKGRRPSLVEGSLAEREVLDHQQNVETISREAREQPALQQLLSEFEGSTVERVNPILNTKPATPSSSTR